MIPENAPDWLKNAKTKNARVGILDVYPYVIWRGGEWYGGEWHGGVWHDGEWRGGEWHGGVWRFGEWRGGVWHGGEWCGGEWRGGEWRGGVWRGGEWLGGEWRGGVWHGGEWRGGKTTCRSRYIPTVDSNGRIMIGCKKKSIQEWDDWFAGTEVYDTPRDTEAFRLIYAHYRAVREYALFMEDQNERKTKTKESEEMDKDKIVRWIKNVLNYEELSHGGERTLLDCIKEIEKHPAPDQ